MSNVTVSERGTEFGVAQFMAVAQFYGTNRKAVDVLAEYPSLEAAIDAVRQGWNIVQDMVKDGAGFTPPAQLGFGSDNAQAIGLTLLGKRTSPSKIRSLLSKAGKQ